MGKKLLEFFKKKNYEKQIKQIQSLKISQEKRWYMSNGQAMVICLIAELIKKDIIL